MSEFPPIYPNFGCSFAPIIKGPPAVTQLFLMYEKPVHPGVYKLARIDGSIEIWCRWDGAQWGEPCSTPEEAAKRGPWTWDVFRNPRGKEKRAIIGWRGLADRPIGHPLIIQRPMHTKYITLTPNGLELG